MKRTLAAAAIACGAVISASAAQPDITSALQWRQIGPFRGGWSTTAVGVPDRPDTFYFGAAGGGVWKTDDAGATWRSIGDKLPAASVGAMAIATRRFPHTIY